MFVVGGFRYLLLFLFSLSTSCLAFVLVAESLNNGASGSGYRTGTEYVYKYSAETGLFQKKLSSSPSSLGQGVFSNLGAVLRMQAVWEGKPEEKLLQLQVGLKKCHPVLTLNAKSRGPASLKSFPPFK